MLLDFRNRLRHAPIVVVPQTGNREAGRPISRVLRGRLRVPTAPLPIAAAALASSVRFHLAPTVNPPWIHLGSTLTSRVRFAPVPLEQLRVAGVLSLPGPALAGHVRRSRRAAEIARENDRLLLELGEL